MKYCTIEGCNNKHSGKGLCSHHYSKWYRYGNALHIYTPNNTKECTIDGCTRKQQAKGLCVYHYDKSISPEKQAWKNMKRRCYNTSFRQYKDYGGRGIKVYDGWINDFDSFHSYIGNRPSNKHTLDRIDNSGNYEPGNVRWATWDEQIANKRPRDYNKENPNGCNGITTVKRKNNTLSYRAIYKRKHLGYFDTVEKAISAITEIKKF